MTKSAKNPESDRHLILAPDESHDRMNEVILLKLNDLEYQVDDLELNKKSHATKKPVTKNEARD
jgi:hypothetical protein